ncbi:MAG: hypothetical protein JNM56_16005, partial [Planctomycetia bacterium]|nr:hypothetical protein [Planctomycetia bacterium]
QRAFEQFTQRQGALAGLADQLEAFALGPTELAIQQLQELGASVEELVLAQEALDILGKANGAKGGGVNLPQALTAGSAEAVSFQNRAARAAENLNRQDDMAALKDDAKKVLEVLRDILKANKDVAKAVKDQNPIGEQNI